MEVISPGEDAPNPRPSELPDHTFHMKFLISHFFRSYEIPDFIRPPLVLYLS